MLGLQGCHSLGQSTYRHTWQQRCLHPDEAERAFTWPASEAQNGWDHSNHARSNLPAMSTPFKRTRKKKSLRDANKRIMAHYWRVAYFAFVSVECTGLPHMRYAWHNVFVLGISARDQDAARERESICGD